jgi:hypothetical protein
MSFPSDVVLPSNAKYYGFIDNKTPYNSHWDLTWSFSFALTGTEHGFTTFLTTSPDEVGGMPGQYLGYLSDIPYLTDESGDILMDQSSDPLLYDMGGIGILAIAFDTTGLFALSSSLSSNINGGVPRSQIRPNSLIIRDFTNTVIYNKQLSSLDTSFFLTSAVKNYQTLRFRLSNAGKRLFIDKRLPDYSYDNLLTLNISSFNADTYNVVYPGFTFCSPISGSSKPVSTLFLKDFHVQGNTSNPNYETIEFTTLLSPSLTTFTTISGIL